MIFAVLGKFAIIFPIFARDFLTCLDMIQCDEQHLVLEYGSVVWHHPHMLKVINSRPCKNVLLA